MSGKPITGIHYERIDYGWKREAENGTEFHYDIELGHPLAAPVTPPLETNRFGFEAGSTYQTRGGGTMRIVRCLSYGDLLGEGCVYYADGRAKGSSHLYHMDLIHPVTHAEKRA